MLGPIRSFTVKKKHIGSAFSEILRYRQKKLSTLYNRILIYICLLLYISSLRGITVYGLILVVMSQIVNLTFAHIMCFAFTEIIIFY